MTVMTFQLAGAAPPADMSAMSSTAQGSNGPDHRDELQARCPGYSAHRCAQRRGSRPGWRSGTAPCGRRRRCGYGPTTTRTRARRPRGRRRSSRCHGRQLVGGGPPGGGFVAHDDPADGRVADHEAGVDAEPCPRWRRGTPPWSSSSRERPAQRLERHALDPGQHPHQVVAVAGIIRERGDGEAAVAGQAQWSRRAAARA